MESIQALEIILIINAASMILIPLLVSVISDSPSEIKYRNVRTKKPVFLG